MWRMLGCLTQNLQNLKKSPKVADESMFNVDNQIAIFGNNEIERRSATSGWKGFSIIFEIVIAPFSAFSCFSQPHVNGSDGVVWASAEFAHMSEINHLMVTDSLRYAILM